MTRWTLTRWILTCALVAAPSMSVAATRQAPSRSAHTDLSTIDYALPPAGPARAREATWRMPDASWREPGEGDLRLRVRLRPNKAMGRVSLSF